MEPISRIEMSSTRSTPQVVLDPFKGEIALVGDSYPEDALQFYSPILSWAKNFLATSNLKVNLHIDLNYINSSSTKCLLNLFDVLEKAFLAGRAVEIFWYFDQENDVAQEIGEEFKEDYKLPFNFVPYEVDVGGQRLLKVS
jgi:SiaC family regulatory phosphoprotein